MRPSEAETDGVCAAARLQSPVATSLVGKAFEFLNLLLMATLVPRLLEPSDYGMFALAVAIVTIGSASLSPGGVWLMARLIPAAAPADRATVARASAWHAGAQIAWLAALAAVLVVAAPLGLTRLKEPGSLRGDCAFGNWVLDNPLTRRKYNGKPFSPVSA